MTRMRFDLRRRLLLSVIGAVALVLVALIVGFNVVLSTRLSHDANNELFARASAELASLHVARGQLAAPELPDAAALDARTWVFAGRRLLEHPRSDRITERAAELLNGGPRRTQEVPATHIRLYSVPVVENGKRLGTVVAEVSLKPYENTEQTALVASLVLGLVVLIVVAIASRLAIAGALRPVADMTAQAAEWSHANADLRFEMGPSRDDLTQLATTLDGLLDRVATSLRHEQRFSAELSHELRTPLANVIAEAQFALRHASSVGEYRAGYEKVLASAHQMSRTLDTLLAAARAEVQQRQATGDAAAAAHAAAQGCSGLASTREVTIEVVDPAAPIRLGVEADVAERILAPLVENGARHGDRSVTITIERQDRAVVFLVADDGHGVNQSDRERIFEPGWQGDSDNGNGAGLGLPLARRLARAVGGDVNVDASGVGALFRVTLPGA
jgi:two-component system OmpR family sensor kinase